MLEPRPLEAAESVKPDSVDANAGRRLADDRLTVRTGVDVQSIERFREMDDAVAAALRERVFSDDERAYCDATGHPAQHYAVRWAATEAVLKLLDSPGSVAPGSVTVVREDTGPALALADEARRALATTLGTTTWHTDVSLSHDREAGAALAQVVVVTEGSRA